jgi:L-malate glycosyltransferase
VRLLVYPHDLSIGGSQINAIDLAAAVARAGHEVVVYGIPGPLVPYIADHGLRFLPARRLRYRPAPSRVLQLAAIARRERIDLIHAYEWPPCLDAYYGARLLCGVPVVCTVLSMSVMPHVPASVPLIMGTADLAHEARRHHRARVWVLEPPIDTARDHPGVDGTAFREAHGVSARDLVVVSVSRLAIDMKLDALVRAIDAADMLADRHPIRLILVGGGDARTALMGRAAAVNHRRGREVVTLPGATFDPRAAYAGADVVIGMGSSALRALAIGRPVVVQGETGFSEVFDAGTLPLFLRQGFYGHGDGAPGARRLAQQLDGLLSDPARRRALRELGRRVVCERFSLERAAGMQVSVYEHVLRHPPARSIVDAVRAARSALMTEVTNHDPARKRRHVAREERLLAAAASGAWPPAASRW